MKVTSIKQDQEKEWNAYVCRNPFSYPHQLFGWKRSLEGTYGLETHYLAAWEDSRVVGVLPLFIVQGRWLRNYLSSLPGGVLADHEDIAHALFEHAKSLAQERGFNYLKIRDNAYPWNLSPQAMVEQASILDMRAGPETLWREATHSLRQNVRKGQKSNLRIDTGKQYLGEFYQIFTTQMRDLGTPVFSFKFFQHLVEEFPKETDLLVAKLEAKVVSAMFTFSFKKAMYAIFNPSLKQYLNYRPNDLICWETIQSACRGGIEYLYFGKNRKGSGAARFKQKFKVQLKDLYTYYYLNKVSEIPQIGRTNWKFRALSSVWRKLPVEFTRRIGPIIRKDLPFG